MSVKEGIKNILDNRLDAMRDNFSTALSAKAVEKLEERKVVIGQNYFAKKD